MIDSKMRTEAIELIDIKFRNMVISLIYDDDCITADFVFDTLLGALDMAVYLHLITYDERCFVFDAALEALYK